MRSMLLCYVLMLFKGEGDFGAAGLEIPVYFRDFAGIGEGSFVLFEKLQKFTYFALAHDTNDKGLIAVRVHTLCMHERHTAV